MQDTRAGPLKAGTASPRPTAPADAAEQAAVEQRRRQARGLAAQLAIAQQQVLARTTQAAVPPPEEEEEEEEEEALYPVQIAMDHVRVCGADEASLKKLRAKPCKALRIALGEAPGKDGVGTNRAAIVRLLAGRSLDEATTAAGLLKARALKPERERARREKADSEDNSWAESGRLGSPQLATPASGSWHGWLWGGAAHSEGAAVPLGAQWEAGA